MPRYTMYCTPPQILYVVWRKGRLPLSLGDRTMHTFITESQALDFVREGDIIQYMTATKTGHTGPRTRIEWGP